MDDPTQVSGPVSRRSWRPLVAAALAIALLGLTGCSDEPDRDGAASADVSVAVAPEPPAAEPPAPVPAVPPSPQPAAPEAATPTPAPAPPAAAPAVPAAAAPMPDASRLANCTPSQPPDRSVARLWDEAALDAIRLDIPMPPVHARNLYHLSTAMWDAWAAYDPGARGVFLDEKQAATDVAEARRVAVSFAAYRLLRHRYAKSAGAERALARLDATLRSLCLDSAYTATDTTGAAAFGNRVARTIIEATLGDGSLEARGYADRSYRPLNRPLIVARPGTKMRDPARWQPLALELQVTQNGLPLPGKVQKFVGPQWGHVTGFALEENSDGLPIDPGGLPDPATPRGARAFALAAVEVLRHSRDLDAASERTIDISPGARGGNSLGANDGSGHPLNPATGRPYAANPVRLADYARAIVELWADGPSSETPPGHWNALANAVGDRLGADLPIGAGGSAADRLEWDVKLYLALNGALHDAAIAAWGAKRYYDSARPISMIRYLGGRGQSSRPEGADYDPSGLPLIPGLIEIVSERSSRPGARHAALAGHVGAIAVRAWLGPPKRPAATVSGVGWRLARTWMPYQRASFVTPAFAGYVSGHSTFSRAAAEVLTSFTGSAFFPGGLFEQRIPAGSFRHEVGPERDLVLQWATYYDAADEAGVSRIYGGIHIGADDVDGRRVGARCGRAAWLRARQYFAGTSTLG